MDEKNTTVSKKVINSKNKLCDVSVNKNKNKTFKAKIEELKRHNIRKSLILNTQVSSEDKKKQNNIKLNSICKKSNAINKNNKFCISSNSYLKNPLNSLNTNIKDIKSLKSKSTNLNSINNAKHNIHKNNITTNKVKDLEKSQKYKDCLFLNSYKKSCRSNSISSLSYINKKCISTIYNIRKPIRDVNILLNKKDCNSKCNAKFYKLNSNYFNELNDKMSKSLGKKDFNSKKVSFNLNLLSSNDFNKSNIVESLYNKQKNDPNSNNNSPAKSTLRNKIRDSNDYTFKKTFTLQSNISKITKRESNNSLIFTTSFIQFNNNTANSNRQSIIEGKVASMSFENSLNKEKEIDKNNFNYDTNRSIYFTNKNEYSNDTRSCEFKLNSNYYNKKIYVNKEDVKKNIKEQCNLNKENNNYLNITELAIKLSDKYVNMYNQNNNNNNNLLKNNNYEKSINFKLNDKLNSNKNLNESNTIFKDKRICNGILDVNINKMKIKKNKLIKNKTKAISVNFNTKTIEVNNKKNIIFNSATKNKSIDINNKNNNDKKTFIKSDDKSITDKKKYCNNLNVNSQKPDINNSINKILNYQYTWNNKEKTNFVKLSSFSNSICNDSNSINNSNNNNNNLISNINFNKRFTTYSSYCSPSKHNTINNALNYNNYYTNIWSYFLNKYQRFLFTGKVNNPKEPVICKESNKINNIIGYALNTNRGTVRSYNEDKLVSLISIDNNITSKTKNNSSISYFAIYDGHGGSYVSKWLADNLHYYIIREACFPDNIVLAIKLGCKKAEEAILLNLSNYKYSNSNNTHDYSDIEKNKSININLTKNSNNLNIENNKSNYSFRKESIKENRHNTSGSCAIVALIVNKTCYIINIGDSRGLMSCNLFNNCYILSVDHKPNNETEKARIELNGGKLWKQNKLDENCLTRVIPGGLTVIKLYLIVINKH